MTDLIRRGRPVAPRPQHGGVQPSTPGREPVSTTSREPVSTTRREPVSTARRERVSVIVCAFSTQRMPVLRRAVRAAGDQLQPGDELLLVIDHNEDLLALTRELLATEPDADPSIRVIPNLNARGLSGARNTGAELACGDLLVFLDDDAVPRPGWLEQLVEPFADPAIIGTGGLAAPAWELEAPEWLPEEFLWVVGCSYRGVPAARAQIRNPIGANMAFRRAAILAAGGFTDGIGRVGRTPLGCEETELSIRATRAIAGHIVQQPAAAVDHLVTQERTRFGYFVRRCWAEGISKAVVTRLAGGEAALASERRYTTRTLPAGVARGLFAALSGDPGGFQRALAIIAGFAITVAGYARGAWMRNP